jgi:DedD protein
VIEVSPTGRWSVLIGSCTSAYRAETLAGKARDTGHRPYTEGYRGLTRVKVGPFPGRPEAAAELSRLEADGFEGVLVPADAP